MVPFRLNYSNEHTSPSIFLTHESSIFSFLSYNMCWKTKLGFFFVKISVLLFCFPKWKCDLWFICFLSFFSHPSSPLPFHCSLENNPKLGTEERRQGCRGRSWYPEEGLAIDKKEQRKEEIEKELKIGDGQMGGVAKWKRALEGGEKEIMMIRLQLGRIEPLAGYK